MNLELENTVAIVTGGAKGIGEAITRTLVQEGSKVAIFDKDQSASEQLVNELGVDSILPVVIDLTDLNACKEAIAQTVKWSNNRLDFLINNAGINDSAGLNEGTHAFITSLERNLHHVYALTQSSLPYLKSAKGSILNISSKVATTGQGNTSGYAAAKGAVNALTREWALELAPAGVRVNAIAPAEVYTPLYESWLSKQENPTKVKQEIESQVPLGQRMTTTQEIANQAVFLLSPKSSHTTGQIFYPDGGYTHLDRACTKGLNF
jgi:L-fucose dehydrogenase